MVIKYGCITLRAIEERDLDLLFYLINAPEIETCTVGWNFPVSYRAHRQWIEDYRCSSKDIRLMIELSNSKTIGMVMLEDIDWKNRTAEMGIKVGVSQDRMKGDTVDAVRGMLKYAFEELGLNCVRAVILEDNILSHNLCRRVGFTEEGVLRSRTYKRGKFLNLISYSMLKEEFVV